jgi:hypothetical protein
MIFIALGELANRTMHVNERTTESLRSSQNHGDVFLGNAGRIASFVPTRETKKVRKRL